MYCPNCEFEIKDEEHNRCPICDNVLIKNSLETEFASNDLSSDSDQQFKELIRDIDEKITNTLEDSDRESFCEHGASLEVSEKEGPTPDTFELYLDDTKNAVVLDMSKKECLIPQKNINLNLNVMRHHLMV